MAPIAPPVLKNPRSITLPPPLSDPPTIDDSALAVMYCRNLCNCFANGSVAAVDLVEGALYERKVLAAVAGDDNELDETRGNRLEQVLNRILPNIINPLLEPMRNAMTTLQNDITSIKKDIADIKEDVVDIKTDLCHVRRISALTHNTIQPNGPDVQLEIVPFPNGNDPTKPPYALPALTTPDVIRNLSRVQRDSYYHNYYHGHIPPHVSEEREVQIFKAIGHISY